VNKPTGVSEVDLSNKVVTPGLLDVHVHIATLNSTSPIAGYFELVSTSDCRKVLVAQHNAYQTMLGGFTTLRDMGEPIRGYGIVDLKRAIDEGLVDGPRLFVATRLLGPTGGHGDLPKAFDYELRNAVSSGGVVDGAENLRKFVREEFRWGADWIKVVMSGGFYTPGDDPCTQTYDDDEIKSIIDTAKSIGIPVTAHIYPAYIIKKAVNLGLRCVEHGAMIDEDAARVMEEKGAYLIPTMNLFDKVIYSKAEDMEKIPKYARKKFEKYKPALIKGRQVILNCNIKIGYGSDSGLDFPNTEAWREFESMIRAGINPLHALKSATSVNAEIINRPDLGVLSPGKTADIVAWDTDPTQDIKALRKCIFVMKEGKVYKNLK
jgi:imidazolonepropionase-like amidohydrolase